MELHMDIKTLITEQGNNSHSFAMRYNHSVKNGGDFHKSVDFLIGHLYDYYGGKKFTKILNDIKNNKTNEFSEWKIDDLVSLFTKNPKGFTNKYTSSKNAGTKKEKEFSNVVDTHLSHLYEEYQGCNFSHIFYDLQHPNKRCKKCKLCQDTCLFLNYKDGYSDYCSVECARKDADRVSPEMREAATKKRTKAMVELKNDPKRGAEYRKKLSEKSSEFHNRPEIRKQKSEYMKYKIATGKFTPCITNSWNHWNAEFDDKKFRSRFEAIFYAYCEEHNIPVEYEKLRVSYTIDGKKKNYIVDFIDNENKIVYEIKPSTLVSDHIVKLKEEAAIKWCNENGYSFQFITENNLRELSKKIVCNKNKILKYLEVYKWN